MDKEKALSNDEFIMGPLAEPKLSAVNVNCVHRSTANLKYYLRAEHMADAEIPTSSNRAYIFLRMLMNVLDSICWDYSFWSAAEIHIMYFCTRQAYLSAPLLIRVLKNIP